MQVNKLPLQENTTETEKPQYTVLTVSELTQAIKLQLETNFRYVYLQGEISNLKLQSSGHVYFSLKDEGAQIAAVMFRGDAASLLRPPQGGDHVIVLAEISVYAPRGNYQLLVRKMRYMGLGELLAKLEELKQELQKRGWFDPMHKKILPRLPKKIGVVTSPTGAVIQDILNVLRRRFTTFQLILNPVKVQGEGAAQEIAAAIEQFNTYKLVDVLIVGRGGGTLEDLWAFNEEIVAEAIFKSRIPIISAVGHETDHCIADLVADVRAPTPSAAAEIVIAEKEQCLLHLKQIKQRTRQYLQHKLQQGRHQLKVYLRHPLFTSSYFLLARPWQQIDEVRQQVDRMIERILQQKKSVVEHKKQKHEALNPKVQFLQARMRCLQLRKSIVLAQSRTIQKKREVLQQKQQQLQGSWQKQKECRRYSFPMQSLQRRIAAAFLVQHQKLRTRLTYVQEAMQAIDPRHLLQKGYAMVFSEKQHCLIVSVKQLAAGDQILVRFADGHALVNVNQIITPPKNL